MSDSTPATAADWQPTPAGVDAVMAAVNTPVDDEGVAFVTEPDEDDEAMRAYVSRLWADDWDSEEDA